MVYNYVPVEPLLSKITSDLMLAETSYLAFVPGWIAEVVRKACGTKQAVFRTHDKELCFHKTKIPCNVKILDGVSYKGQRLRHRDIESVPTWTDREGDSLDIRYSFPTKTVTVTQDENGNTISTETLSPTTYWNDLVTMPAYAGDHWYAVEPGNVICSLETGLIRLHTRMLWHDDRDLIMIPDNEFLFEAISLWVRCKLIGTGRRDPVYQLDDRIPMQRYKENLDDAISQMDQMTPDQADAVDVVNRPYPVEGYKESFSQYISPIDFNL